MTDNQQRAAELLGPTYTGLTRAQLAAALDAAEARGRAEVAAKVRAVYDLQCLAMSPDKYVSAGAYSAHKWWERVLGRVLDDLAPGAQTDGSAK